VSLDGFDGFWLDLVCAPPTPNHQPNSGSHRIPSVIGGPGPDFIAAQMEPVAASRSEERDITIG